MAVGFDIEGIEEFTDGLKAVQSNFPKEIKSFMQKEGNKLKKATLSKAESSVNKKTGNYFKGIKRGKYYRYQGKDSIRVYAGPPAYHAHLLEYGHEIKKEKGGRSYGRTRAFNVFSEAGKEFEPTFEDDCEKFAEDIMKKLD